eukprot:Blabericola_migrator_1__8184@NODE_422_length_8656_cov_28_186285_g334_i0_p6_GENE_NODE_422_length_8656_cov_28_186285_g334_i0NODE_422_length_8656_cov_28_186285_g334_i0_p6_ORF_typecomplete_len169_score39_22_NODE_422_length_8656_cov_28_186285_g334_i063846890
MRTSTSTSTLPSETKAASAIPTFEARTPIPVETQQTARAQVQPTAPVKTQQRTVDFSEGWWQRLLRHLRITSRLQRDDANFLKVKPDPMLPHEANNEFGDSPNDPPTEEEEEEESAEEEEINARTFRYDKREEDIVDDAWLLDHSVLRKAHKNDFPAVVVLVTGDKAV